jgi:hypothetical protein
MWRRLHRDERGNISQLLMLGAVPLFLMIALLFNTGALVSAKTRVQNAADAAAVTHASWEAHHLNLIAMNNVGLAQMFSVFMITEALTEVWVDAVARVSERLIEGAKAQKECASTCKNAGHPILVGLCFEALCGNWQIHMAVMSAIMSQLLAIEAVYGGITQGLPTSLRLILAYSKANEHLVSEFPKFSKKIVDEVNNENDVKRVELFTWDNPFLTREEGPREDPRALPVRQGALIDLCQAADNGTENALGVLTDYRKNFAVHGYENGKGPYEVSKPFPIEVMTRGLGVDSITGLIGSLKGGDLLDGGAFPAVLEALPGPMYLMSHRIFMAPYFVIYPEPKDLEPLYDEAQTEDDNKFKDTLKRNWDAVCAGGSVLTFADVSPVKIYVLQSQAETLPGVPHAFGSFLSVRDDLAVMSFATDQDVGGPLAPTFYVRPTKGVYAQAQAQVYNPISHDLYTQAWSARLSPARFISEQKKRTAIGKWLSGKTGFRTLSRFYAKLDEVSDADVAAFNVH